MYFFLTFYIVAHTGLYLSLNKLAMFTDSRMAEDSKLQMTSSRPFMVEPEGRGIDFIDSCHTKYLRGPGGTHIPRAA